MFDNIFIDFGWSGYAVSFFQLFPNIQETNLFFWISDI